MGAKVAVVTGAGGGLGLAIARALAAEGLAVHLTDLDADAAAVGAESIGGGSWSSGLDVCDADACRAAAATTVERAGGLDVWVNNAGVLITGFTWEMEETAWRTMFDVNTVGTINGTFAALDHMREAGSGHVINIISLAGLVAAPGEALYAASKHAAIAFTIGTLSDLRRAGIDDIHLSAVCPDGIWTPMLEPKLDDPDAAASWSGKMLMPEEVAEKVIGLLEHPRPVISIPRWRGWFARAFDAMPRVAMAGVRTLMKDARRRQMRFKKRLDAGRWPPK